MYAGHSFTFLVGAKMKDARNCGYAGMKELRCTGFHVLSSIRESKDKSYQGQQEYQCIVSD